MSILNIPEQIENNKKNKTRNKQSELVLSKYNPTSEEINLLSIIVKHFGEGYNVQRKPRREFNDLSLLSRMTVDQMMFNTYQPNDGDPTEGDEINRWKSQAVRPIVRNKVISIAAHATARLIFPKIFAQNKDNEEQV